MLENFSKTIIQESDYICGNKFIELTNFYDIQFCKTDFIKEYKNKNISKFITHNSDYHITDFVIQNAPNYKYWYAQNKDIDNKNIISIPIGLENFEPLSNNKNMLLKHSSLPINGAYKKQYINEISNTFEDKINLVYLNFNPSTYITERSYVHNSFVNKKWVHTQVDVYWKEYYDNLFKSKFVFSPRGNGVDCHRTWEAIYLRTFPIVINSKCMDEFKDLPILFIKNWNEINEDFLLTKYEEMNKIMYNLDKCKMSYWAKRILNE